MSWSPSQSADTTVRSRPGGQSTVGLPAVAVYPYSRLLNPPQHVLFCLKATFSCINPMSQSTLPSRDDALGRSARVKLNQCQSADTTVRSRPDDAYLFCSIKVLSVHLMCMNVSMAAWVTQIRPEKGTKWNERCSCFWENKVYSPSNIMQTNHLII